MTLNCKGQLIDLARTKVMGILNITPDSFYDGGTHQNEGSILNHTEKMLKEGATFIDVGAYSSRPGADDISESEELKRIVPVVSLLLENFPEAILSIDTFRSTVAKECLQAGAAMVNDISAGERDEKMMSTVARFKAPYIIMHMRGNPNTMQQQTNYKNLLVDIIKYFSGRIAVARSLGLIDLIIDPGFGFAKTVPQNFELLNGLELFQNLNLPIMTGLSRKSMIYRTLKIKAEEALNGTTALHMVALMKGANILRAHDVKEAMECIKLAEQLKAE